jgi:hypothetical protein
MERCLALRTTLGVLAFVGFGAAATAGVVAVAHTLATRQPPQAAALLPSTTYPSSNESGKTDRLPVTLASFGPIRSAPTQAPTQASPVSQYAALEPNPPVSPSAKLSDDMIRPSVADQPAPQAKPRAAAVKPPKSTNVVLNDTQIASLKQRLKLSPSQEQYWPEVEAALRGVVKQIYEANRKARGATVPVDTTTPEVERLKTAAMPLLMQMRPDQKAEVVTLARIIGMEKLVAML